MANFCRHNIFLVLIAVALIISGCNCDDGGGLAKVCLQPIPCGISQSGDIVTSNEYKAYIYYDVGECKFGTLRCDDEGVQFCEGFIAPTDEICDGLDNDCDGEVDDGFDRDFDGFTSCNGDCDDTRRAVNPDAKDICDGLDNDCNGQVDENIPPISCWGGPTNAITDGTTACQRGQQFCKIGRAHV